MSQLENIITKLEYIKNKFTNKKNVENITNKNNVVNFKQRNGELHKIDGFNCVKCNNTGGTFYSSPNGYDVFKTCSCVLTRKTIRKMMSAGFNNSLKTWNIKKFNTNLYWQKKIKNKAISFIKNNSANCFFIGGRSATGKTFICFSILLNFMRLNSETAFLPWPQEIQYIKSIPSTEKWRVDRLIHDFKTAKVLFVDDLLKNVCPTKSKLVKTDFWEVNLAFDIINTRSLNKKLITLISCNKNIFDIFKIDQSLASRICHMSLGKKYCSFIS